MTANRRLIAPDPRPGRVRSVSRLRSPAPSVDAMTTGRDGEGVTEVELLAQIADDVRDVRNIVRAWWWLLWISVALILASQITSA